MEGWLFGKPGELVIGENPDYLIAHAYPSYDPRGRAAYKLAARQQLAVDTAKQMQDDIILEARQGIGVSNGPWVAEDQSDAVLSALATPKDRKPEPMPFDWDSKHPALFIAGYLLTVDEMPTGGVEYVHSKTAMALLDSWETLSLIKTWGWL